MEKMPLDIVELPGKEVNVKDDSCLGRPPPLKIHQEDARYTV
jgi:hypothetical protein